MQLLDIYNPFGSPVWLSPVCPSTMTLIKELALQGQAAGSVLIADRQTAGRGRMAGRSWQSWAGGSSLAMSIFFSNAPGLVRGLSLRIGLGLAYAVEKIYPLLAPHLALKWPNDLLIHLGNSNCETEQKPGPLGPWRKLAGILCEGNFENIFVGIGMNIGQTAFNEELAQKATSLRLAEDILGAGQKGHRDEASSLWAEDAWTLRNTIAGEVLQGLYKSLAPNCKWRQEIESRLWNLGQRVQLEEGLQGSGRIIEGKIAGLAEDGSLLLEVQGRLKTIPTGELLS